MTIESILPWKEVFNKKKNKYQIYAADNLTVVVENVVKLGDALYIEEACNNYPEAIDLLKSLGATTNSKVYKFLSKNQLL